MISQSSRMQNEEFDLWNRKLIHESAKMIKLIMILLIIWIFFTVIWIVHLIIQASTIKDSPTRNLYKRSESGNLKFEDLRFYTESSDWDRIKTFIGTFHRLKESEGKVPELIIYAKFPMTSDQIEESSAWNKVKITSNHVDMNGIWISADYSFDPVALDLRKAELLSEADSFKRSFEKGRRIIEKVANECLNLIDGKTGTIVLKSNCRVSRDCKYARAQEFGLIKNELISPGFSCYVDLKIESILTGAEIVGTYDVINKQEHNDVNVKKKLAIGVPTTSKGMNSKNEKHVLLTALIPSLIKTLTKSELNQFQVTLFIGYDKGDEYFEDVTWRNELKSEIERILLDRVNLIFLRLKPLKRVAMTWNMIFAFVRRNFNFDYFYQVNDDLTMKTSGWLTKFTETLSKNNDTGVAGPSDSFNGFSCSLLTQAFVTKKHFEQFSELLYPLAFRDWKSDRWLSFVYGEGGTFCWPEIEATNGAKGTRYKACPFPEWKIFLQ